MVEVTSNPQLVYGKYIYDIFFMYMCWAAHVRRVEVRFVIRTLFVYDPEYRTNTWFFSVIYLILLIPRSSRTSCLIYWCLSPVPMDYRLHVGNIYGYSLWYTEPHKYNIPIYSDSPIYYMVSMGIVPTGSVETKFGSVMWNTKSSLYACNWLNE